MSAKNPENGAYERVIGVFGLRFERDSKHDRATKKRPEFTDYESVVRALEAIPDSTSERIKLISGGSRGVESCVERWCGELELPFERVRPDTSGDSSNPFAVRNQIIISKSTEILILWDGIETGFDEIATNAVIHGKPVHITPIQNV